MKSSDSQAHSHALFELNASSIEYASRRRRYGLPDHRFDHKEPQGGSENDDENEALEAV